MPPWLRVSSLSEPKNALAQLIVLVIAIEFVEKLINAPQAIDVLYYAIGVGVVGLMLVALTLSKSASKSRAE